MIRRPVPYGHLSMEQMVAHISRAFGQPSALRTYNMKRGDERAAAYAEDFDNPPAPWSGTGPDMNPVEARKHIELAERKAA